ncbi:MAG: DJ-1/PfpI family protein [Verrucomicrobia bacterium]|nr:DJ-1/PfpI family protein [Verrucomicrobiota bacterium]
MKFILALCLCYFFYQAPTLAEETPRTLGVLLFPGFEMLDACGPMEIWGNLDSKVKLITVAKSAGPVMTTQGVAIVAQRSMADCPKLDLLLVPGGMGAVKALKDPEILNWLRERSAQAEITMSVCNGASILAAAGLLDGRPATTNKAYWKMATKPGPKVKWIPQARWVDDGNIVTSSGVSAGIDMTLHVVDCLFGLQTAESMADTIEHEWHRASTWDPFAAKNGLK